MTRREAKQLSEADRKKLAALDRAALEDFAWEMVELARKQAAMLGSTSQDISRPPSSDPPWTREERGRAAANQEKRPQEDRDDGTFGGCVGSGTAKGKQDKKERRKPGKQPGASGRWRRQPLIADHEQDHRPCACQHCGSPFDNKAAGYCHGGHHTLELDEAQNQLRVVCTLHRYWTVTCPACQAATTIQPGEGAASSVEGRKRDLRLTERCLIGPRLATFIAALSLEGRMSRLRICVFLQEWLGLEVSVGTINRCIHEFGLASEPVAEKLLEEVRQADLVHIDETPWYQSARFLWLWVVVGAITVLFHIGRRTKDELVFLIGEAFLGWIVSDGYAAYRDHGKRQRCLAHLIRKALALSNSFERRSQRFGAALTDRLRCLIKAVSEDQDTAEARRLTRVIQAGCRRRQDSTVEKVRALARELLNDWGAVIAFVNDPHLPPTNKEAERALRHAVIARRISFGTRTHEGSRFYAASLSIIATCRKRAINPWTYAAKLIADARCGLKPTPIPA